ncbi:MAG: phosphotransferase family protein [Acidobacteriaceae bacterium]
MMKWNIAQVLDGRFACPHCHASQGWAPAARVLVRQYSSIHRMRCERCGERIVVKVVGGRYSSGYAREHARKEYEALCKLQSAFPQDKGYGTLVPLGHLEYAEQGIVITRHAPGEDLVRYVRTLDASGVQAACRSAGIWLKKLHESDVQNQKRPLGAADKISFLADKYGAVLRGDPRTDAAYELFIQEGTRVDAMPVPAVRQHGDFKPDNMLCDGTKYVGLDIRWRSVGAAAYDLAPFLNHLWSDGRMVIGSRTRLLHDRAESAFLSGYGDVGDMCALRWVQLYFALCYMGEYRQRGRLAASYANWKIWPLVRRLALQVREFA